MYILQELVNVRTFNNLQFQSALPYRPKLSIKIHYSLLNPRQHVEPNKIEFQTESSRGRVTCTTVPLETSDYWESSEAEVRFRETND